MSTDLLERLYRSGNFVAAAREFQRLLVDLEPDDNKALAWAHFWGAKVSLRTDLYAAVKLFDLAAEYAGRAEEWELTGRVRLDGGEAYRRLGDTHQARSLSEAFLADLSRYPQLEVYQGAAHYNLGIIYRHLRDVDASIFHYRQAIAILEQAGRPAWLLMALQNLAWVLSEQDQFGQADDLLDRAQEIVERLEDRGAQLTQHYVLAYSLMLRGETEAAARLCEEIMTPGSGATEEQTAWALFIAAECGCQVGHYHNAMMLCTAALETAVRISDARIMNYISLTRRKILSQLNHPGIEPA